MINFSDQNADTKAVINMTPLIDVVFILLIFFLLTATNTRGIVLDLPQTSTAESIPVESWEIAITKDEKFLFNGVEVKKDQLAKILSTAKNKDQAERLVILKAHKQASVNVFISVMDTVRKTGFYNLVIATSNKTDEH